MGCGRGLRDLGCSDREAAPVNTRALFDTIRAIAGRPLIQRDVDLINAALALTRDASVKHEINNPGAFYTTVRTVTGSLNQMQVDTIQALLAEAAHWPASWMAYGLATAWHEARLEPIEEIGKGKGKPYGAAGKYGQPQYGRGLVQLTWDRNYEWADRECCGGDGSLLANFGRALEPDIAALILIRGMETGAFTGKKLADYLPPRANHAQFAAARKIINGADRADMIANYAETFQTALIAGGWG